MAKILFISPLPPWPLFSGGQIRAYHLIKALSQKHQITLVQYITEDETTNFVKELLFCYKIETIKRRYKPWSFRALLKSFFSSKPLLMNLYQTETDLSGLFDWADLIWQECFYTTDKTYELKNNKKLILGEQNIEYLAYGRYFQSLIFWKKILLWLPMQLDLIKMKYWEKKIWQKAHKIAVVSHEDKKVIEKETRLTNIEIISNGVDTAKFTFNNFSKQKIILFVGEYKWFPNREAIKLLIFNLYPIFKEKLIDFKLLIVGKHMPDWLKANKEKNIVLDEKTDDIREAYKKASVFIAPLRSGSGTKYKILEAMACGVPVVTTAVGSEGLDKTCMIVRQTDDELAEATIDILVNPQKYSEMAKGARKMVEERFTWEIIGEKLEKLVKSA